MCEVCLGQALEIVNSLIDTLQDDLGLNNIHLVYSGRGYHIRILDEEMMTSGSELRSSFKICGRCRSSKIQLFQSRHIK